MMIKQSQRSRGFTLIELIVSLGLFAIISTVVAAAYLNLVNIERRTRDLSDIMNNLSFAMDSMARSLRTGTNYQCIPGDAYGNGTCHEVTFKDANGCTIDYALNTVNGVKTITQTGQDGANGGCVSSSATALLDPRVNLTTVFFYVSGRAPGATDNSQPQVVISMLGSVPGTRGQPSMPFNMQTTATQRVLDI